MSGLVRCSDVILVIGPVAIRAIAARQLALIVVVEGLVAFKIVTLIIVPSGLIIRRIVVIG